MKYFNRIIFLSLLLSLLVACDLAPHNNPYPYNDAGAVKSFTQDYYLYLSGPGTWYAPQEKYIMPTKNPMITYEITGIKARKYGETDSKAVLLGVVTKGTLYQVNKTVVEYERFHRYITIESGKFKGQKAVIRFRDLG